MRWRAVGACGWRCLDLIRGAFQIRLFVTAITAGPDLCPLYDWCNLHPTSQPHPAFLAGFFMVTQTRVAVVALTAPARPAVER
jgi:hypothetical protein